MTAAWISRTAGKNLRRAAGIRSPFAPHSSPFSNSAPAVSGTLQQQEKERRSTWSKMFLFVPGAITFGLGSWQIARRQDKIKMLEHRQRKLGMEPLKGNQISPSNQEALEFRRIQCKGVYDEKKAIFIGPRSRSISGVTENGYYLITPLIPVPHDPESVQSPILVNRGWVPRSWRDKALDATENDEEQSSSSSTRSQESVKVSRWRFWTKKPEAIEEHAPAVIPVEVIGVTRGSENPSIFVPANDPTSGQWFSVDVPAIARACGLPEETIYVEDVNDNINPSRPYPLPKDVNTLIRSSVMPQDHLNYTLTWYSLSAAVTFMAVKLLKPGKIRR